MDEKAQINIRKYDIADWWLQKLSDQKKEIEHCDVKDCPECNLKAYNKGRKEAIKEIVERIEAQDTTKF